MSAPPPSRRASGPGRLQRCIRDLAALNALPSLCVGRTPEEALGIILDALPTALELRPGLHPAAGSPGHRAGHLPGTVTTDAAAGRGRRRHDGRRRRQRRPAVLRWREQRLLSGGRDPDRRRAGPAAGGRGAPLDPETDRVLVRTAANVVGTIVATATCWTLRDGRTTSWRLSAMSCAIRWRRS